MTFEDLIYLHIKEKFNINVGLQPGYTTPRWYYPKYNLAASISPASIRLPHMTVNAQELTVFTVNAVTMMYNPGDSSQWGYKAFIIAHPSTGKVFYRKIGSRSHQLLGNVNDPDILSKIDLTVVDFARATGFKLERKWLYGHVRSRPD